MRSVRKQRVAWALLVSLSLTCLIGWAGGAQAGPGRQKGVEKKPMTNSSNVDSRLTAANMKFGFSLYAELAKQDAGKNILFSPASVAIALAMAYNGAEGATKQVIERALSLPDMTRDEINAANANLKTLLESVDPKVQLQIANSLWARQGVSFRSDFMDRNRQFYGAEVRELNFNSPAAAPTINAWVKEKTAGKIDRIVDQISAETILFLINAIYFKGKWRATFDAKLTVENDFTLATGAKKRHPMMNQKGRYSYFENDRLQAVSLPYGDKRVSMYVFLPKESSSLADLQRALSAENWGTWMSQFRMMEGNLSLPRFKVEYESSLKGALGALGMEVAFGNGANFSGMIKPPVRAYIHEVKHKAFAEVNEEGTEAAAVTSIEMRTTSLGPTPPTFTMVVNRPFFFAICDNQSGSILFMGSINEPK